MGRMRQTAGQFRNAANALRTQMRRPRYDGKIFCVGYNKTGTTSCGRALTQLGFRHTSFNRRVYRAFYMQGRIDEVLDYTARFESFDDLPWLKEDLIPVLDEHFPGSKFIHLTRDEASWIRSLEAWSLDRKGVRPDRDDALAQYRAHTAFIASYFADRPTDEFLTLDIRDPMGFRTLASFVGRTAPQDALPHVNKTPARP
ncbi:MAG: sulfotransferase [Planctomycetota bacterium]